MTSTLHDGPILNPGTHPGSIVALDTRAELNHPPLHCITPPCVTYKIPNPQSPITLILIVVFFFGSIFFISSLPIPNPKIPRQNACQRAYQVYHRYLGISKHQLTSDSKDQFLEITGSRDPVVIDCYAEWCGPCKFISPQVETWSNQHEDVKFYKVDVDRVPDVAQELGVRAMPTFYFFKDGQLVNNVVGASAPAIKNALDSLREST